MRAPPAAHCDWPVKPKLPFTPGHEGVGVVEESGAKPADLVATWGIGAHAAGKTRVIREERPLADVQSAMEDVLHGDVPARIVFRP
jgi:NADPH:quinone reductase-like Zn-dependent oxidoreductase